MRKKEFPDIKEEVFKPRETSGVSEKISIFSGKAFGIIKFLLGLGLLPFVYTFTTGYLKELSLINISLQHSFWCGVITLLLVYLFVWEPVVVYTKGQKILELLFSFFKPFVKVAPYLLPVYTIILFIIYGLLSLVIKEGWLIEYAVFLTGFTISLHLIFSAKTIRGKKGDFLKGNYIFGFSFVYLVNVLILAFLINLLFKEFSFVSFFNGSFQSAKNMICSAFKQLF